MFLDALKKNNPSLIYAACYFRQKNLILPDTYVLDLDAIVDNAIQISEEAKKHNIELFYMTKQFGRNPLVAKKISDVAIPQAVVVDFKEALLFKQHNLAIGHLGHLVQTPLSLLDEFINYGVSYITVYSLEELNQVELICKKNNVRQNILIKIVDDNDIVYDGQKGGFKLTELLSLKRYIDSSAINIAGITSFPCFLFDGKQDLRPTKNCQTIKTAEQILNDIGFSELQLNMPSATCCKTLPMIKSLGGTQAEPGHALTGTTPLHASESLAEKIGLLYLSEISHHFNQHSYMFGGGYYSRGHLTNVIVQSQNKWSEDTVNPINSESIDYYLELKNKHAIGNIAISCFRTQMFVTRSDVAVVSGIKTGNLKLEGIFNGLGHQLR